ncbi:hypothetical protein PR001_g18941 [Phytophthora rubi]|uniref:Retrovirus-related Pol polyprotein from transposon TNT 1-94-like beta-barrel domain-containing protein n=1 Tax=Phytophthora rubi TaxID=129364 RepID=A0A6A3K191_9STRA|nr:hypothetical protein PR001_g18941 [Phytophthora rubi]
MEKLREDNYYHWEYNMRMKLSRKGHLAHIALPQSDDMYDRTTKEWFEGDLKALGLIALEVDVTHQVYIRDAVTAREAWERLQVQYNNNTLKNQIVVTKRLHRFKMEQGSKLSAHIDAFKNLVCELKGVGDEVPEPRQIVLLLGSLTEDFDVIVSVLENSSSLSLIQVIETLSSTAKKIEGSSSSTTTEGAFVSRKPAAKPTKLRFKGRCFFCGKKGRKEAECWEKQKTGKQESSHHAHHTNYAFAARSTTDKSRGSWLVDSGASSHMTHDVSFLRDYTELQSPLDICIADGGRMGATGRGTAVLDFGDYSVTLSDVLHVPSLDRNLISVQKLASMGVTVAFSTQ